MKGVKGTWLDGLFLLATLGMNGLGGSGFFNGLSQGEVSFRYPTLLTPSPGTFGIWGLIYGLLLASILMRIAKSKEENEEEARAMRSCSRLFRLSCVLNMGWIVAFSYLQLWISLGIILALAITLALISRVLQGTEWGRGWLLPLTFGIYGGWLFIATVVNVTVTLVKEEWGGFGFPPEAWGLVMLVLGVLLVALILLRLQNGAYPLPVAWGYLGISLAQGGSQPVLMAVALAGAGVLVLLAVLQFFRNGRAVLPESVAEKRDAME